jgi:hypothetical protein
MKKYVHVSFLFFILTALTGIWMRTYPFAPPTWMEYDHILHAHSHLALLGWIFMGAFIIFLSNYWSSLTSQKHALAILLALSISSIAMFFAFLYEGYGIFSIALSTIHIFVEYWAAIFIVKQLKRQSIPKSGRLFIIGSIIALVISSLGPYALGAISATGNKESALFEMAIYFYLHFQYNGWLTLFLIGLFILLLAKRKIKFNESRMQLAFWVSFIALFPSYAISILWVELGTAVHLVAGIGSILQWVGIVLILVALKDAIKPLKRELEKLTWLMVLLIFSLLFIKSTLELGMIHPELSALVNETRHVIIGYLHLVLLGFISIFILVQYQMQGIIKVNRFATQSFTVFFIGFTLNELLLFLQTLGIWTDLYSIAYLGEGLLLAAILLGIGVVMMSLTVPSERKTQIKQSKRKNSQQVKEVFH